MRLYYLVHVWHYHIVEIKLAIFVVSSSKFLYKFHFCCVKLFNNFIFLITVNSNANSVKSLESPNTSSHTIYNHPLKNIICKIRFHKIIKINSTILLTNVSLPDTTIKNINKSDPRWWLTINYCKRTLEQWNNTITWYEIIFKYSQKIWNNASKIKKIIVVRMFIKICTKSLQILVKFYSLYGFIFNWLPITLLIMKYLFFIPSVCATIFTQETFPREKIYISCEKLFKKIIIFINAMIIYIVIFQINNIFKRFRATQTLLQFLIQSSNFYLIWLLIGDKKWGKKQLNIALEKFKNIENIIVVEQKGNKEVNSWTNMTLHKLTEALSIRHSKTLITLHQN